MRRRAARMILTAVAVVALIFGIPAAVASSLIVWNSQTTSLDARVQTVQTNLDRRLRTSTLSEGYARMWAQTLVTRTHSPLLWGSRFVGSLSLEALHHRMASK